VGVIVHILLFLEGDTATLCSCACVATAWRDAVSTPAVWRTLAFYNERPGADLPGWTSWRSWTGSATLAAGVCGETLALLVRRAGAALEVLDISHASRLTNADLACLSLPAAPSLRVVRARGDGLEGGFVMQVTPKALIAALSGRMLERLEVKGLVMDDDDRLEECDVTVEALSQLVQEDGLDAKAYCEREDCRCLTDEIYECKECGVLWCAWCETGEEGEGLCEECL